MTEDSDKSYKVPKARILFIYVMAFLGVSLAPLDSYLEDGSIDSATWIIALISFLVGMAVIQFVLYRIQKYGKFMHYDLNSRK